MMDSRAFRTSFATFSLFTVLAGDAWRYSVSWYGFGVIAVGITVVAVMILVRHRDAWTIRSLPLPLLAFLALATASLVWSAYPGSTALGLLVTFMTVTIGAALATAFSWTEILRSLGLALRIILGSSLVFELFVSFAIRQPVLPLWAERPDGKVPLMLFWSRDVLFEGGRIQGIVGNSALLAFVAFLGVIVFAVQLAARTTRPLSGWAWLAVSITTIALTRSATIYVGLGAVAFVVVIAWLARRAKTPRQRVAVYGGTVAVIALGVAGVAAFGGRLLELVGKSPDLTGRLGIWDTVIGLAQQRPIIGWGWVSYWTPWAEPFRNLIVRNGVVQLHAHNAWLDMWLQLGVVGVVVFAALVGMSLVRSWILATRAPLAAATDAPAKPTVVRMLPLLILVALLAQSAAESRLLVEYGLLLLVLIAVGTKRDLAGLSRDGTIR